MANLKKKDEPNRMKNQRDVSKILTRPFILVHPIKVYVDELKPTNENYVTDGGFTQSLLMNQNQYQSLESLLLKKF